jgi:hypothetical protein
VREESKPCMNGKRHDIKMNCKHVKLLVKWSSLMWKTCTKLSRIMPSFKLWYLYIKFAKYRLANMAILILGNILLMIVTGMFPIGYFPVL